MKLKVTEQGVIIPKELLGNCQEVELSQQEGQQFIIINFCQTAPATKHYPLRGKPITIASDFDEAMPELWEALGE
jgi:hypothetical protein